MRIHVRPTALACALGFALMTPTVPAVETERVMVPRYVLVNGSPVLRMVPVYRPVAPAPGMLPGLPTLDGASWDETAVRKVLHVFAFGGHASDAQVKAWADASPTVAIQQMLTFAPHNLRLSPPSGLTLPGTPVDAGGTPLDFVDDDLSATPNTLRDLSEAWSTSSPDNPVPEDHRARFDRAEWSGAFETWTLAARARGLNPFRHRIGLWETNFHLASNHRRGVSNWQLVRYYDDMLADLEAGRPYEQVIRTGAISAAIAQQYGHRYNEFWDGVCYCNEDFAREFHQLGFGILGINEPTYHETVSIKNTAKALTGIRFIAGEAPNDWEGEVVGFRSDNHVPGAVEILHATIPGATMASKIDALAKVDIAHPESLGNLPLMIVQNLADDTLSTQEILALRQAWRGMAQKNLLTFLRAYAVSTLFHSPNRTKQWTSIDRFLLLSNLYTQTNLENYHDVTETWRLYWDEEVVPFEPHHDVFGHQTGAEAAGSAEIFRKHFVAATESGWRFLADDHRFGDHEVAKDWRGSVPLASSGSYEAGTTARWLWQRFIADGYRNFGPLERAHLLALLARGRDLVQVVRPNRPDATVSLTEVTTDPVILALLAQMETEVLRLDDADPGRRATANRRIGAAINFLIATPFMLAQEGR